MILMVLHTVWLTIEYKLHPAQRLTPHAPMGLPEPVISPELDLQVTGMRLIFPKAF